MKIAVDLTEEEQICATRSCIGCNDKVTCPNYKFRTVKDGIYEKIKNAIQQAKTAISDKEDDTRC